MLDNHTVKPKKATEAELYEITAKSAKATTKQVFIFEKGEMADLFDKTKAEDLRKEFVKNGIKVKQITNIPTLPKFSENDEFVNKVMTFRYVPKKIFTIEDEIVIFDDTVAIYNQESLLVIENENYANNMRQLFSSIWEQGQSPTLGFDYRPNHSLYKPFDFYIGEKKVIVYPDADAKTSYAGYSQEQIEEYIKSIIVGDAYFDGTTYFIVLIWSFEGKKMVDIWRLSSDNFVDDRSGPLGDARVYKDGKVVSDMGLTSGNTLILLGYEEVLRRQSKDLKSYLDGPRPTLPLEIVNGRDFFEE